MKRVYVDMVGDLFHAGHVEFLRQARAFGDELVVGVHADDECEWYKRRPVLTLEERVAVVESCRYVDRVVPAAPALVTEAWLDRVGADLVVHGDDMDDADIRAWYPGAVARGIMRTVPYTSSISSRDIVERASSASPVVAARGVKPPLTAVDRLRKRSTLLSRRRVGRELRELHDALAATPIGGRYWMWGGALLGWAREGRLLAADLHDVDFAYLDEDHGRFLDSVGALVAAGFVPTDRFSGVSGRYEEHRFRRGPTRYEFFRLTPTADGARWSYSSFDDREELRAELPAQPLVEFEFLGRRWQKVADHEAHFELQYGDWRTPDPHWDFRDERTIVERRERPPVPREWRWPTAVPRGPGEQATPWAALPDD